MRISDWSSDVCSSDLGGTQAAEYDSLLKVVRVLNVTAKNFKTDCFPYDFWCLGNEPFWSVEISGGENLIRLTDMGTESAYFYEYTEPTNENEIGRASCRERVCKYV